METMFKSAKPTSKLLDGPDAIEGAVFLLTQQIEQQLAGNKPEAVDIDRNTKRY
jgi:hypothetical protein